MQVYFFWRDTGTDSEKAQGWASGKD